MTVHTVSRERREAARAAVRNEVNTAGDAPAEQRSSTLFTTGRPDPVPSTPTTVLEGILYTDPDTAQRALVALVADEVQSDGPAHVIALPDDCWAVDMPEATGNENGVVVAPRVDGADIDAVRWEALPREVDGGPVPGAQPLVDEPLGVQPSMVHELLALVDELPVDRRAGDELPDQPAS